MKLFLCPKCNDVVKMVTTRLRACACGSSAGMYDQDGESAHITGQAIPLGIDNDSLSRAVAAWRGSGAREPFEAFVYPRGARVRFPSNGKA